MKKFLAVMLSVALLSSNIVISANAASAGNLTTFYVSAEGNETGDGSFENPFATIEAARDAVRSLKKENGELPDGGVCVYLRGGIYNILSGIEFTEEDSGTAEAPVTYRSYNNEKVTLVGGVELKVKDFRRVADENELNRIYDKNAREYIYQYDLSEIDGFQYGSVYGTNGNDPNELVVDGQIMTIARWPNITASGNDVFENPTNIINDDPSTQTLAFTIEDTARANNWNTAKENIRFTANWRHLWSTVTSDRLDSVKNGIITLVSKKTNEASGVARFYVSNLLEELDQPGEFYIDTEKEILYFFPPVGTSKNSEIYISMLKDAMFTINGASYITFRGFDIPCSRGKAFDVKKGDYNLIAYNNITNLGGRAVSITGGTNNGAVGNYVSMCDGGIEVGGGDRATLTPGNNYAENNHTEKFSRITKTYLGGVMVSGCGNRASHNEINDALHLGMQFSGNENVIEYNEFYDLLQSVDDSGGIYAGRTWVWRGNQIKNNYFHDFYGSSGGVGLGCIYFDDSLSGNSITGNIFANIPGRAAWVEAGSDNNIENNIMINVGTPIRYADRGNAATTFEALAATGNSDKHIYTLEEVPYTSTVWIEKYPILKNLMKLPYASPNRAVIKNNVYVDSGNEDISASVKEQGNYENNIVMDNTIFEDAKNGDFTLKADAAVYSQLPEFEDTHFEKMGRYTEKLEEIVKDSMVLGINRAGAKNNGEMTQIDKSNDAVMPIIINNRTMVPVRYISESLGADVTWNAATQEIGISYNGKSIVMHINSTEMTVDGNAITLDSAPTIRENRTLVPLRAIVEALDKQVFWDDKGLIVIGDDAAIFDSTEDAYLIDDLLRQINLR